MTIILFTDNAQNKSVPKNTEEEKASEERLEYLKRNIIKMMTDPKIASALFRGDDSTLEDGESVVIHSSDPDVEYIITYISK